MPLVVGETARGPASRHIFAIVCCVRSTKVQTLLNETSLYRTLYPSGSWDGPSSKDAALSFNLNLPNITEGVAGGAASFELEIDGGREPCEPPSRHLRLCCHCQAQV